ncbi:MAG: hypothetical protein HY093_04125 [Candidatus Liptonbacteria bacterium]|nr:hypothetical protein [Candidatus Liptonbacteria bacterium]
MEVGMMDFIEEVRREFVSLIPLYLRTTHSNRDDKIKSDGTPVGNIDVYAGDRLRSLILRRFPSDVIIAEEDEKSPEEVARILADKTTRQGSADGLDGTGNRGMRLLSYGAMLSLRHRAT